MILTHSVPDSETSIDFVQGPPGSRRERVKEVAGFLMFGVRKIDEKIDENSIKSSNPPILYYGLNMQPI